MAGERTPYEEPGVGQAKIFNMKAYDPSISLPRCGGWNIFFAPRLSRGLFPGNDSRGGLTQTIAQRWGGRGGDLALFFASQFFGNLLFKTKSCQSQPQNYRGGASISQKLSFKPPLLNNRFPSFPFLVSSVSLFHCSLETFSPPSNGSP